MPRPMKCRRVEFMPGVTYFKPAGIPMRVLEEVILSLEEAEAVRLKDLEGLERTIADLKEMGIQRLGVSHCTGFHAAARLAREFPDIFFLNNAGTRVTLP